MMTRKCSLLLLFVLSIPCTGCGKAGDSGTESSGTPVGSASANAGNGSAASVSQVVQDFLEAVRLGNTEAASGLLTPLALQRTREMDLNFSPPGSSTAKFSVGEVELIDSQRAIVHSVWTDLDADGKPGSEQITWALKQTDSKWRISGMAAEVGENQPPVVMDFENPGALAGSNQTASTSANAPRQANSQAKDPFQQTNPR